MKVLYIGKYPPIQGGTSSSAYWRFKGLKEYGIQSIVVTCIPSDNPYQCSMEHFEDVHILSQPIPWHIPYSQIFSEQLVEKSLKIVSDKHIDVIEGCYLFPYCFAAFIVSLLSNKPLVIRHAGSDLFRVTKDCNFDNLLIRMASHASVVVTNVDSLDRWRELGISTSKLHISKRYYPNPNEFVSLSKDNTVVFLGKITPKWNREQLDFWHQKLVENNFQGKVISYSDNNTREILYKYFKQKNIEIDCMPFVEPQCVPQILSHSEFLFVSSLPDNIPERSNLLLEGIACGCKIISMDAIPNITVSNNGYKKYLSDQLSIYESID